MNDDNDFANGKGQNGGRKAFWFTFAPILVVLFAILAIAFKQHWFSANDRLYTITDSSLGMVVGMSVKVQGFPVGAVSNIALMVPEHGTAPKVRLTLNVNRENIGYIGKDSMVRLARDGIIGQPILEIISGNQLARRAADGDTLEFVRSHEIREIADELGAKADRILTDVKEVTEKLKDPNSELMHTLATTKQAVQHLDVAAVAFVSLVKKSESVVSKVGLGTERAMTAASNLLEHADDVMPKVNGVLDNALDATGTVKSAAARIDGLLGGGNQVVSDAQQAVADVRQVVVGAKRQWPFSLWVPKEQTPTIAIDSQDNGKTFVLPTRVKDGP